MAQNSETRLPICVTLLLAKHSEAAVALATLARLLHALIDHRLETMRLRAATTCRRGWFVWGSTRTAVDPAALRRRLLRARCFSAFATAASSTALSSAGRLSNSSFQMAAL